MLNFCCTNTRVLKILLLYAYIPMPILWMSRQHGYSTRVTFYYLVVSICIKGSSTSTSNLCNYYGTGYVLTVYIFYCRIIHGRAIVIVVSIVLCSLQGRILGLFIAVIKQDFCGTTPILHQNGHAKCPRDWLLGRSISIKQSY